jgi:hypothetical protein
LPDNGLRNTKATIFFPTIHGTPSVHMPTSLFKRGLSSSLIHFVASLEISSAVMWPCMDQTPAKSSVIWKSLMHLTETKSCVASVTSAFSSVAREYLKTGALLQS